MFRGLTGLGALSYSPLSVGTRVKIFWDMKNERGSGVITKFVLSTTPATEFEPATENYYYEFKWPNGVVRSAGDLRAGVATIGRYQIAVNPSYMDEIDVTVVWLKEINAFGIRGVRATVDDSTYTTLEDKVFNFGEITNTADKTNVKAAIDAAAKAMPAGIGATVVIDSRLDNYVLPYPILGVTVGVSPNGNYVAQVGTSYYEFVSGMWVSNTADLEAKIADLQTKVNNAKAALAAAQTRLNDLRSKAQALGITI